MRRFSTKALMMSSQQDGSGSPNNYTPSLDRAAGQAAEEYLPKAAKIKTAEHLLWTQDLQSLGATERNNVQRYIEEKVFRNGTSSQARQESASTIIVCDNIYGDDAARKVFGGSSSEQTVATSTPSTTPVPQPSTPSMLSKAAPYLLTAALTASGMGGAAWLAGMFDKETPPPSAPTVVDTDTDTDTQYLLELVPDEPQ